MLIKELDLITVLPLSGPLPLHLELIILEPNTFAQPVLLVLAEFRERGSESLEFISILLRI